MFCSSLNAVAEGVAHIGYGDALAIDCPRLIAKGLGGGQRWAGEQRVVTSPLDHLRIADAALPVDCVAYCAVAFQSAIQRTSWIGRRLFADRLVLGNGGCFGGAACCLGVGQRPGFGLGGQPLLFFTGVLLGQLALLLFLASLLFLLLSFMLLLAALFGQALLLLAFTLLLLFQPLAGNRGLIHLRLNR